MWVKVLFFLGLLTVSFGANIKEAQVSYSNYKVYKVQVENHEQYQKVKALKTKFTVRK